MKILFFEKKYDMVTRFAGRITGSRTYCSYVWTADKAEDTSPTFFLSSGSDHKRRLGA